MDPRAPPAWRRSGWPRAGRPRRSRPGPARPGTAQDLVRRVAAGRRVGQPDLDEPGLRSGRDLAVLDRGPVRRIPTSPGPSVVDAPDESVCSSGAGHHPRHDHQVGVGVRREPLALAQQVLVVADHRAEGHVLRVVPGSERERVQRAPARGPVHESVGSTTDLHGHLRDCARGGNRRRDAAFGHHVTRARVPARLPVRHQHGVVPDRGRGQQRRQGPEHLGHLHREARHGHRRLVRRRRRATTTTATARTSR